MAAKIDIHYSCGCGMNTYDPDKAIAHTEKTGHTLTVLGTIGNKKK